MASSGRPVFHAIVMFVMGLVIGAVVRAGAADTLTIVRPLSGSQRPLVSKNGKFALGFFQPDSSQNWYMGIWYNQISKQTPVWVANRNSPISDPDLSQLTISSDGNMVLLDHSRSPIWSTNTTSSSTSNSTVGVILDTGNLVLAADTSNTSALLWQSFDHFGDTWLPSGKLGRNKLTGVSTRLFAWRSYGDPAPGLFSLVLDPNRTSQFLLLWNNTKQYWSSGNWTGSMFTAVPEMSPADSYPNSLYTYGYVDAANESYFIYGIKGDAITTRFVVDATGRIKFLTWLENAKEWMLFWSEPKVQCDVYSLCGPFSVCTENALTPCSCLPGFNEQYKGQWSLGDNTVGCRRNAALQSSSSSGLQNDKFYNMVNVKLPSNAQNTLSAGSTQECELACLSTRSCTAYSFNGSCSLWHGDLINLQDLSGSDTNGNTILIRLAASEFNDRKDTKRLSTGVIVAVVVAGAALLVVVLIFLFRGRFKATARVQGLLMAFTYRDLQALTRNFSDKLGGGAFGSVFKGSLPDATLFAVKKLEGLGQGEKEFRAEVSTIGTVQHVNLIRLLGFCSQSKCRLLVYEYMPNASLDRHLFGSSHQQLVLSWSTRYQIALGIARGLDYLHNKCRDCIIHCDIKPENILLDDSFVPKVADFGLAKLLGRDFSRVLTTVRGTAGYLAPEWIAGTAITSKADVFSYGMVLFEIVSGRRNARLREDGSVDFFPLLAVRMLAAGDELEGLVDSRLGGAVDSAEVERACRVAGWCIQDDERDRPAMATVLQFLEGLVEVNVPPAPRSFKFVADADRKTRIFSVNNIFFILKFEN